MSDIRYKHIMWDWNGTLLDDTWLCVEVLNEILKSEEKSPISVDDYRMHFGFPVIKYYEHLGFPVDESSFAEVSRRFISAYEARWLECELQPGADHWLKQVSDLGVTQSVLSAAKQEALEFGVNHFGLRRHFMALVGLDNIYAAGKVELGKSWIAQLDWDPAEVLLIGDTLHDHEVAEAMGTDCVLFTHGHHPVERLSDCGVPVLHHFDELEAFLMGARPVSK